MKFAKELEQDLVPEWKAKYLNYKEAKKKLKTVERAYKRLNSTPKTGFQRIAPAVNRSPFEALPPYNFGNGKSKEQGGQGSEPVRKGVRFPPDATQQGNKRHELDETAPINITKTRSGESTGSHLKRYGSIIGSPPEEDSAAPAPSEASGAPPSLHLPDPALQPTETNASSGLTAQEALAATRSNKSGDAFNIKSTAKAGANTAQPQSATSAKTRHMSLWQPRRTSSTPSLGRTFSRRVMSMAGTRTPPLGAPSPDVELAAYRDLDFRQAEFFDFLGKELNKIDQFYREKEEAAMDRMKLLREQLHIMRDRRLEDLKRARKSIASRRSTAQDGTDLESDKADTGEHHGLKPWQRLFGEAQTIAHGGRFGKGTKAMEGLATPSNANLGLDERRDYTRRKSKHDIPYRTAKRKLKIAMQEFYRGLELLKSFALLNRTGFRKINKKYDKTVNARPSYKFMNDKVNKAWFVQSDVVDDLIRTVEDLYARYFEQGNHKIAAGKLRAKAANAGDYTGSVFRSGIFLATGAVFGIQGLVYGAERLFDDDPTMVTNTSYLLQIYAGYFMMLLLVQLFCLACRFWTYSKINYVFVFEFDTRHHLNWRQISELPCFCWLLLGFFMWLNFTNYGANAMYIYYPVILISITLILLFFPLQYIYPRTRSWFLYSNWRLLLAGLYPVEFRDFFLGDMYCSETYAMGNIELFFCLYAHDWDNPPQCNSSHSRLLGFFSALPGVWRALQCIRRYIDTRNAFPHLANCAKYGCTILYYMTLSLYRVHKTPELKAVFIAFATINATYCTFWDLVMDWSLLDPYAKHRFLRDTLGYKQIWLYYLAMVVDPILRFNWIFYAIFAEDLQHSAILSFFVSLSEVGRRGLWLLFRVENEHCTNVGRFRASRDIPLPYTVDSSSEVSTPEHPSARPSTEAGRDNIRPVMSKASGTDVEAGHHVPTTVPDTPGQPSPGSLRRRHTPRTPALTPTLRTVGTLLHNAHAQDYAKKKKPEEAMDVDDDASSDEDYEHGDDEAHRLRNSADIQEYRDMRETDELLRNAGSGQGHGDPDHDEGGPSSSGS